MFRKFSVFTRAYLSKCILVLGKFTWGKPGDEEPVKMDPKDPMYDEGDAGAEASK